MSWTVFERRTGRLPAPFRSRAYRRVWLGGVAFAFAMWTQRVALGWYVFDATDSAFVTASATAAISAAAGIAGPFAGAIADRSPRPRILALASVTNAAVLAGIALLVVLFDAPVGGIVALAAVSGVGLTFSIASLHTLSGDLSPPERRASAISLVSLGQRAVSAVGAVGSGVIIGLLGVAWAFAAGGLACLLAAAAFRSVAEPAGRAGVPASLLADVGEGLRLVTQLPVVAVLLGLAVVAEIFGFSYDALLPVLAERALSVGPAGLGGLVGAAGLGAVCGTLFLSVAGDRVRHGPLFLGVFVALGGLLVLLGASSIYLASLAIAAGVGACLAMVDALQWIMLQAAVPDRLRGRALGAWTVAVGFGWIGRLLLGALADIWSVGAALATAGAVLLFTGALAAALSPRVRRV